MLVNLYLKEGNVIKNCGIFPEEVREGDTPYLNKEELDQALSKVPWGFKFVSFQTENIHGKVHVNNIERYEAIGKETLLKEYESKVKIIARRDGDRFNLNEIVTYVGSRKNGDDLELVFQNEDGGQQRVFIGDFEQIN